MLKTARRAMLRRAAGVGRQPNEDYVDWIIRATRKAESTATISGVRDWYKAHLAAKWSWAGHVARSSFVLGWEGLVMAGLRVAVAC